MLFGDAVALSYGGLRFHPTQHTSETLMPCSLVKIQWECKQQALLETPVLISVAFQIKSLIAFLSQNSSSVWSLTTVWYHHHSWLKARIQNCMNPINVVVNICKRHSLWMNKKESGCLFWGKIYLCALFSSVTPISSLLQYQS